MVHGGLINGLGIMNKPGAQFEPARLRRKLVIKMACLNSDFFFREEDFRCAEGGGGSEGDGGRWAEEGAGSGWPVAVGKVLTTGA